MYNMYEQYMYIYLFMCLENKMPQLREPHNANWEMRNREDGMFNSFKWCAINTSTCKDSASVWDARKEKKNWKKSAQNGIDSYWMKFSRKEKKFTYLYSALFIWKVEFREASFVYKSECVLLRTYLFKCFFFWFQEMYL